MASEPLLDFAALTAPIAGDSEAGDTVPYALRQKLDTARKEEEPNPDDPSGAAVARKVDWLGIIRQTQEVLTEKSKDLLLAARLTEALTKQYGFAGLRDGLHLLADLVDQCWERIHPIPDEGEGMDVRAGPFHWISDADRGARFPNAVKDLPLVLVDGTRASLSDWKRSLENKPLADGSDPIPKENFVRAQPLDENVIEDLDQALQELTRLEGVVEAKFADAAPGMIGLRQVMEECRSRLATVAPRPGDSDAEAGANGEGASAGGGPVLRAGGSREQLYGQVGQIADMLERLEPHSPIPDLLRRAVELGRMPFRQLVRELIRDPAQLAELRREFGIKDPDAS